jgi:hypothetical protein
MAEPVRPNMLPKVSVWRGVAWFECGAASGYRYFDCDASSTRGVWASPNTVTSI